MDTVGWLLTVVDKWSRESILLEADFALSRQRVADAFDRLGAHPLPKAITVDNAAEFTPKALDEWAYRHGVQLDFIRPGKPIENGMIESFNGRLRDECLNVHTFTSIGHFHRRYAGKTVKRGGSISIIIAPWLAWSSSPKRVR